MSAKISKGYSITAISKACRTAPGSSKQQPPLIAPIVGRSQLERAPRAGFDRSTNLATSRSQRVFITRGSAADGLREGVGKIERVKKIPRGTHWPAVSEEDFFTWPDTLISNL